MMLKYVGMGLCMTLGLCPGFAAEGQETQARSSAAEQVRRTVETGIEKGYYSGAVVLAGREDRILLHKAFGHARVSPKKVRMRADSIFDLASVTKAVATATACAVCKDEGLVDLERPVGEYLANLTGKGTAGITLWRLGSHTSGLDNRKFSSSHRGEAMLGAMLGASPVREPGTRYEYSCLNLILLGLLVEEVSGQPLDTFCEERIFGPLGMGDTVFGPVPASERVVATSGPLGEINDTQARLAGRAVGNAGLFSTATDLSRFCRMMLGEGRLGDVRVLSTAVVQEITHQHSTINVERGFGWDLRPEGRPRGLSGATYYHTGWTGQSIWIDPENKLYVIVLTNRNHPKERASLYDAAKRFRIRIADMVLEVLDEER